MLLYQKPNKMHWSRCEQRFLQKSLIQLSRSMIAHTYDTYVLEISMWTRL